MRTMQLNAWVDDNFMNAQILFLPLVLYCHNPKMLKIALHSVSFCITECLVSITMNEMRGWSIILHLLICLFYLLQLNIISLISPKITLALCLLLSFCKMEFCSYLEKNLVRPKLEQPDQFRQPCIRLGVAYVNMHVLRHFKEELAWAILKQLCH